MAMEFSCLHSSMYHFTEFFFFFGIIHEPNAKTETKTWRCSLKLSINYSFEILQKCPRNVSEKKDQVHAISDFAVSLIAKSVLFQPLHGKTNNLQRRKQRCRSVPLFSLHR